jgi:hypothetical protein
MVMCSCSNCSLATGFQAIAQLGEASEVRKIYVNQSMSLQTPVTLALEKDGEYLVSVLTFNELQLQYTELITVDMFSTEYASSEPDNPTTGKAPESESER